MDITAYTAILVITEIAFVSLTLGALRRAGAPRRMLWMLGGGLLLWLGIAYTLITQDLFGNIGSSQSEFVATIAILVGLGLVAQRFWRPFGAAIDAMSTETFLSLQQTRAVFGVIFFLTTGLPLWFLMVGGLGDIAAGVGAFFARRRLQRNPDNVARAIVEGNIVGILDFVVVLNLGAFVVLRDQPITDVFNLIPLVVVPIYILLHIFSLQKLRIQPQTSSPRKLYEAQ